MNGLVAYGRPVTIVLDDLHAVRSEASLSSIGHAIERLPAGDRLDHPESQARRLRCA
jgi:hypothetical protein